MIRDARVCLQLTIAFGIVAEFCALAMVRATIGMAITEHAFQAFFNISCFSCLAAPLLTIVAFVKLRFIFWVGLAATDTLCIAYALDRIENDRYYLDGLIRLGAMKNIHEFVAFACILHVVLIMAWIFGKTDPEPVKS